MTDQNNNDTFYKVTNKDIYQKLLDIEKMTIETRSMSKRAQLISTTALTLSILAIGYLISHISQIVK